MIMAIGGAGCNMAETIIRGASTHWVSDASYIFADTDQARLSDFKAKGYQTILLTNSNIPCEVMRGVEKLYILAGMGGKTGSKYVNIIADSAERMGVPYISAIVTTPFHFEGEEKVAKAKEAIENLKGIKTKILHNDYLLEEHADKDFATVFDYADKSALKAIQSDEI